MAYTSNSSRSDTEVQSCSKNCVKTYEKLQKQFDEQRQTLSKANLEIVAYQLGLESVEAQLVVHQKNKAVYDKKIAVLEFEVKDKSNVITRLKNQLDETLREKDDLKYFDSRSSDGDDNQTNNRFKKDNGYHVVPPPLTGNYMPPLSDLSFAGLDDFVYRPTANKTSAKSENTQQALKKTKESIIVYVPGYMTGNKTSFLTNKALMEVLVLFGGSARRTPQQNGVAERKNMTLIEAARTMLADSLLPTVFWAEAVNTAYYVLNSFINQKKEAQSHQNAVRKDFEAQCNRELLQGKATKANNTNLQDLGDVKVFKCIEVNPIAIWIEVEWNTTGGSPRRQDTMGGAPAQTRSERVLEQPIEPPLLEGHTSRSGEGRMEHQFELMANVPITPRDSPLPRGYTPGSDEGRLKLQELMTMCIKLSKQVLDLKKKKDAQAVEILRLKKRVKGLERQRKSSTSQPNGEKQTV
ncbi:ribonuclease H-like domain-containing protein [Tanacetum coccineum]